MNVRHDRSYISENSRDLIGRGYAAEVLDTLRFRFTYTQVERDANRSRAQTQPYADGIAERAKAAMLRSAEMEQIMATIAEQFVCYQYDDRKYPFRDGGWDLFFWCNCFFNTMPGHGLDGRDYSYFTLSFNEQHTAEKRKEICDSVLALINKKFPANPHLDIALQYLDMSDYNRRSIVPIREMSVSEYLDLLCLERETPLRTVLQEEERAAIEAHGLTLNSFDQSQLNSL